MAVASAREITGISEVGASEKRISVERASASDMAASIARTTESHSGKGAFDYRRGVDTGR